MAKSKDAETPEETPTPETFTGNIEREISQSRLDELVAEKVAAGLPHDTATEVAKRQIAWDAEQAEAANKK